MNSSADSLLPYIKEKLRLKAKQLATIAKEKEAVRRKLVVTAHKLRLKARQLAVTAREKEAVRRKLVITAKKLKLSHETLEKKVRERTKDLEHIRAKEEAILASIGDALVVTDTHERILLVNKAFERLLGWKAEEARGKKLPTLVPMLDDNGAVIPVALRLLTKAIKEKSIATSGTTATLYYKRKDGTSFPVAITVAPIFISGQLMGAVKVFRDITKEKEIDRAKSEFMSLASHQLRTPLTEIRWTLSSLKRDSNLTDEQMKAVDIAHETSSNMAVTIKRMLMISHLEEGGMELEIADTDFCGVLDKVVRLHDSQRKRSGLKIGINCPAGLRVQTDEQLLIEILSNLLSNAYKYTPKTGTVTVNVSSHEKTIRIDIADTGCGIPLAEQKNIPKKFFRASNVAGQQEAGTGIGLYMVYNIARLIGGTISFISSEKRGTTFTLFLPSRLT